jgi:hypothetical protein
MSNNVDAVIAALRVALDEAQKSPEAVWWNPENANRWISQLPGAWYGRWRHLKLWSDEFGWVQTTDFIGHVRAMLAYLEVNRAAIGSTRFWSRMPRRPSSTPPDEPVDLAFSDVASPDHNQVPALRRLQKQHRGVRVIK